VSGKHTPGPWFKDYEGHIRAPYPNHPPGISVARMTCFGAHDVHLALEANAHLISAAPDLLAKLESMVAVFNQPEIDPLAAFVAIEQATAAIAKAKGSTP
jgi:hypothetical protein